MQDITPVSFFNGSQFIGLILLGLILNGCSPTDPTPKIAEDQREVLKDAEEAAASIEQSATKMQQDIDAEAN